MGNEKIIYIIVICGVLGISLGFLIPAVMSERTMPEADPVQAGVSPEVTPLTNAVMAHPALAAISVKVPFLLFIHRRSLPR